MPSGVHVTTGRPQDFRKWRISIVKPAREEFGALVHQKVHVQVSNLVIEATPVGNPDLWQSPAPPGYTGGRARGSWLSSVDFPMLEEPGTIDPDGEATKDRAKADIDGLIEFGSKSYLASAVPYMQRLNEGWSTQEPADFIDRAIDTVRAQFDRGGAIL